MRAASGVVIAVAALAAACSSLPGAPESKAAPHARATLAPTKGSTVTGTVDFTQRGDKVLVNASLHGLKPNAEHGFHVHEKGDCGAPDGMSAGGHFNPGGHPHGVKQGAQHHAGDMPNVRADAAGNANAQFEVAGLSLAEGASSIVGKGLIVHRDPDDYTSQPAGNAGPRLACGVIRAG